MLIAFLLAAALGPSNQVPADAPTCDVAIIQALGHCPTNTGTELVVDGTQTTPGDSSASDHDDSSSPGTTPSDEVWYPPYDRDFGTCLDGWNQSINCFEPVEDDPETEENESAQQIPVVTITDLARFTPEGSALTGEPDNVGVVGLPTNLVTTANTHTVSGELFGLPLDVRFTPVGFDFDHGDGTRATTTQSGQTWAELDQAPFTPTATSHTYTDRGEYSARVDVRYTAAIDLGSGWFPIEGELTSTGPTVQIRIFEAHTALVAHTCAQDPDSPGC